MPRARLLWPETTAAVSWGHCPRVGSVLHPKGMNLRFVVTSFPGHTWPPYIEALQRRCRADCFRVGMPMSWSRLRVAAPSSWHLSRSPTALGQLFTCGLLYCWHSCRQRAGVCTLDHLSQLVCGPHLCPPSGVGRWPLLSSNGPCTSKYRWSRVGFPGNPRARDETGDRHVA